MSLEAGTRLGQRYEVVRAITSGGMGSIYEGRDLQNRGQRVAIKQLLEHLIEGEQAALFRSKFSTEVAFLQQLQHPGIPRAYDSFVIDGSYYMVMEFIVGRNLEQELEERLQLTGQTIGIEQLLRDCRQILEILDYLHNQTPPLLHRDIKPANLIREHPSGRIRLVDFGLARLLSDAGKTQTQLGTLGYSSLEQLQGKADQRSDIYALGASMHHLVTGVVPTVLGIPPVLSIKPDLDPAVAAIIDRACATNPEARFNSAKDMLRALNELRPHLPMELDTSAKIQSKPRLDPPSKLPNVASIQPMEPIQDFGPDDLKLPDLPLKAPEQNLHTSTFPNFSFNQQVITIVLLITLAFLLGTAVNHRRKISPTPSMSSTATGTPDKTLIPPLPSTTTTPELPPEARPEITPTLAPQTTPAITPVAALPTSNIPTVPDSSPEPEPQSSSDSGEQPQLYPVHTQPSYPTARQGSKVEETIRLSGHASHLEIHLDPEWTPLNRLQTSNYFTRSYRKSDNDLQLDLEIKGYVMEQPANRYRRSFETEHRSWSPIQLEGADIAYTEGRGRLRRAQALILRNGAYYWFSLRGSGSKAREKFAEELQQCWDSLNISGH